MRLDKHDFYQLLKKPLVQKTGLLQAEKSLESGAQWLDVRTLDEYELAHFNGAIHGQLDLLKLQQRRLDKACEYICYCNTGVRAEAAAYLLSKDGFKVKALQLGFDHLSQDERQRWIENDIIGS
jgi:rhodanese-related sulfurtransferase